MDSTDKPNSPYMALRGRRNIHAKNLSPEKPTRRSPRLNASETNSLGSYREENESSEDEWEHSRSQSPSSPTKLSKSEYSFQYESSETRAIHSKSMDTTGGSTSSVQSTQKKETDSKQADSKQDDSIGMFVICGIALLFIGVFLPLFIKSMAEPPVRYNCTQFKELTRQFASQDMILFKSMKIGIEGVLNNRPTRPSVFLLAYNDGQTQLVNRLMVEVVAATADCMNSTDPIQLDGNTFVSKAMAQDYGIIIEQYRERLTHNGIMYVADLNRMPAEAAQVFHTICDTVTPLVERAVIFFTVKVNQNEPNLPAQKVLKLVENELDTQWHQSNKVSTDTLKALISRVTDQVFLLKSES